MNEKTETDCMLEELLELPPAPMTLQEFLASPARSSWIVGGPVHAYVRKSRRWHKLQTVSCFDIANVRVEDGMQGQGVFTSWHGEVETIARAGGFEALFVESVLNPVVGRLCEKWGYELIERSEPACYMKVFGQLQPPQQTPPTQTDTDLCREDSSCGDWLYHKHKGE